MDALARGVAAPIQQMREIAGEEIDDIVLARSPRERIRTN
jgi:hypothetical protein